MFEYVTRPHLLTRFINEAFDIDSLSPLSDAPPFHSGEQNNPKLVDRIVSTNPKPSKECNQWMVGAINEFTNTECSKELLTRRE